MRFETKQDIVNEQQTIEKFIAAVDPELKYRKLGPYELDFMLYKGDKTVAFVEVKNFNSSWEQYPSQIISLIKYGKMATFNFLAPTYFMANYSCGTIAWISFDDIVGDKQMFSRRNQRAGAANDTEEVLVVDRKLFKTIKT